jgi:hypothetical protein
MRYRHRISIEPGARPGPTACPHGKTVPIEDHHPARDQLSALPAESGQSAPGVLRIVASRSIGKRAVESFPESRDIMPVSGLK